MRTAFICAAVFAANTVMAAAPINGWYGSVFGGYSYIPGNISVTYGGLTRTDASYTSGYNAGGRIGFQSYPLRYEGEISYIHANLQKLSINNRLQTGISGQTSATTAMANIYYDFPEMVPAVMPFLGLGLGYGWVNGVFRNTGPIIATRYEGSNNVFAYQATAGVTYNFSENYAVNLAYRYVGTDRVNELNKVFEAHLASIGVVYRFDESHYK